MLRRLHSLPGLAASLVVVLMAVTGAILAVQPLIEQFAAPSASAGGSVATLASQVAGALPGVARIVKTAAGSVIAYYTDGTMHAAAHVDPATGAVLSSYEPSGFFSFFTELHRSLFLGTAGHIVACIASLAIAVLAISGALLLVKRLGGWSRLFTTSRGTLAQRLHTELGRLAIVGLVITAVTGTYMALVGFGFISDGAGDLLMFQSGSGGTPTPVAQLAALAQTPLSELRELIFPIVGDSSDVFTLTIAAGQGFVDQASGAMISFTPNSLGQQVYELVYMLHTGQGLWWFGLLLGMAALAVPAMAASGVAIWWARRRALPKIADNVSAKQADTVILVGSEGNTTWGFAETLHRELTAGGRQVHVAAMNDLRGRYPLARRLLVLTATYGEGTAPDSANRFLARLRKLDAAPAPAHAVLGFGDRNFPAFCQFATAVDEALRAKGSTPLLPQGAIDRQSAQSFASWGRELEKVIRTPLNLVHAPRRPATRRLVLRDRTDYGVEVQAPTVILRFVVPKARTGRFGFAPRLPRFSAGDLVGIVPPGSVIPRYYSLASSSRDGVLEICVSKQQGGLCSEFLHGLEPGDSIDAFVKANPDFRPRAGRAPLILIGTGTGIAPLVGFVRHNRRRRPIHLFFGARDPQSDFLYRDDLVAAAREGKLTSVTTAFSRQIGGVYVQDRLREYAAELRELVEDGAQFLVCGGTDMAQGVRDSIDACLAPIRMTTTSLKSKGRYLEDVY